MRVRQSSQGLTVQAIAGTHNVLLGIDLDPRRLKGCLGFSIQRARLEPSRRAPVEWVWMSNRVRFPQDTSDGPITTEHSPVQKFRWGDYTLEPGVDYRYRVIARQGHWGALRDGPSVEVDLRTETPTAEHSAVFFNRGAAASQAYNHLFGTKDPDALAPEERQKALTWLSRGLEEALLAFLARAQGPQDTLHAAVYEFQKPELLAGLVSAAQRGAGVTAVYHHRQPGPKDTTWQKNDEAITRGELARKGVRLHPRQADPQNAISHNKFVVLLQGGKPRAVWTGSTNWTEGALYGQLNVGHAVYDEQVAATYERYFQLLLADTPATPLKAATRELSPVLNQKELPPGPGVWPILSPQSNEDMLALYATLCGRAHHLMVCAPFSLSPKLLDVLSCKSERPGALRYLLVDKEGSLGSPEQFQLIEGDSLNEVGVATVLRGPLYDYQRRLLMTRESFHHTGVHLHSKILAVNPLGPDPILITGSANYSANSTLHNDENSLIIRGHLAVADIYATEFMRMFEHYHYRGALARENDKRVRGGQPAVDAALTLKEDDSWSARFYVEGSTDAFARRLFAGV